MENLIIPAPAKINLFLDVGNKRKDGYHNICSLVEKINLCDNVEVFPSEKITVEFTGPWSIPRENTVSKTIKHLCYLFPEISKKQPLKFVIHKNIPPGSGLGGASSDAAAVLKLCNNIWNLALDEKTMLDIAEKIGSDVPLFLKDGPCVIESKGEIVHPVNDMPPIFFELFVPEKIQVSTKMVYENISGKEFSDLTQAYLNIKIFISMWKQNNIKEMQKRCFNRLEQVSLGLNKEIGQFKNYLESESGKHFMLTGSGGGLYAIIEEKADCIFKRSTISQSWRCYLVKSYGPQKEEEHGNHRNKNFAD